MSTQADTTHSIKGRILTSVGLATLQFLSGITLRLVSVVVLTRLLAPEIYGVFAVVLVYRYMLEMLSDLGLRSVILTREGAIEDRFLWTCWSVSILRGALIWAVSAPIALVIYTLQYAGVLDPSGVYADPVVPPAIFALGGAAFVAGFVSMNSFMAQRDMKFGHVTVSMVVGNITGLIVTIVLAYSLRSVWALVLSSLFQNLFMVVYSHIFFPGPRMRAIFERGAFQIIYDRGKWIVGHSTLTAAMTAADRLLLGFVTSPATFGLYYLARQLQEIVQSFLSGLHGQMGLQVFTHILKSPETFRKNYYSYRLFFDAISCIATGGLYVLAPTIIDILFDDRYDGASDIMQIVVFFLVTLGPYTIREILNAERNFRSVALLSLVSTAVLWGGLTLAVFILDDLIVALWVIALYRAPEVLLLWIIAARRGWIVWGRECLLPVFVLVGIGLGWVADQWISSVAAWITG